MIRALLLLAVSRFLVPALAAQDIEPLPPWEPPLIPPEPPAEECGFSYIGYVQTSQGVLQDDPQDTDFLQVVKGTSPLSRNLASAQEAFYQAQLQYQVPTFEAGIDMVVGRETYLLAANPYTGTGPGTGFPVSDFLFRGTSAFSAQVPVHLRVTAVLNGRIVKQFLANHPDFPETVRLGGSCAAPPIVFPGADVLFRVENVLERAHGGNAETIRFSFDEPGRYLVRAELVRDEAAFRGTPALLRPIGVAVDVRGRVVTTRTLSLQVIPIAGNHSEHEPFADLVERHLVPAIRDGVQYAMAVPSEPAPTTFYSSPWLSVLDAYSIAERVFIARRLSDLSAQPDRMVVVVEHDKFDDFIPQIPYLTSGADGLTFRTSKGVVFVRGPRLVYNSLGYIPPYPALKRKITQVAMHELYHSLGWSPQFSFWMGDCQVAPYHNELLGIANGLDLEHPDRLPYFGRVDIMGSGIEDPPVRVSQCTYRHSLEELSKAAIDPPVLMVGGVIRGSVLSAEVELAPIYEMDGFDELPQDGEGSWKILLRDANGDLLASHPFHPDFSVEGGIAGEIYFNYTVERPQDLDRIEITARRFFANAPPEDVVVASRQLSDHAPTLDVSAFRFLGRWIVEWQGDDADGDPLLYSVLTSTDGGLYLPTEVFESSETGLTLDDPYGSIRHIKVVATDGGRSVVDTLDLGGGT